MGHVMIKCPHTGRELATGLQSDDASFKRMPVFYGRTFCSACRMEHDWFARDAWVAEPHDRTSWPNNAMRSETGLIGGK
jgi:hypothetical protein